MTKLWETQNHFHVGVTLLFFYNLSFVGMSPRKYWADGLEFSGCEDPPKPGDSDAE